MMVHECEQLADNDDAMEASAPCIVIVGDPGSTSLLRALGLLAVSGLSPHSLDLRHSGPDGQAVSQIWLPFDTDRMRLSAVALKIGQLPTVSSVAAGNSGNAHHPTQERIHR